MSRSDRVWSVEPVNARWTRISDAVERIEATDCEEARWEAFRKVRSVIVDLGSGTPRPEVSLSHLIRWKKFARRM